MTSQRLVVATPAELISAVPYLLGFHPADSIVVVGLCGRYAVFAGRHDLPGPGDGAGDGPRLAAVIGGQEIDAALVIGYGPPDAVTPAILAMGAGLRRLEIPVLDLLRVTDGRYWTYRYEGEHGYPAAGQPCASEPSAVSAAATFAGQVALPDRSALVAQLAPVSGAERAVMGAATLRAQDRLAGLVGTAADAGRLVRRAGCAAVREAEHRYRGGGRLRDDAVAWLGVLLVDLAVRDYAWERAGDQAWQQTMWTDVLRRVEPAYVPAPASLLAFAAWRDGRGALARAAIERALDQDPGYRMAQLVQEAISVGLPPSRLAEWPNRPGDLADAAGVP